MKKRLMVLLTFALALCMLSGSALGASLNIISTFSGGDAATQSYYDLLEKWQQDTGNSVTDYSVASSEDYKSGVLNDTKAGVYDLVMYWVGAESAELLPSVVPLREVLTAYPDIPLTVNPLMTESDGNIYAVPVRPIWEELICNTDLFEQYGLELPTTWDQLVTAIETFKANDVVPIAIPLAQIPHYIAEVSIMASGTPADFAARPKTVEEIPESWYKGMELIRDLYQMGAFPVNTAEMFEEDAQDMFSAKQAAMIIEGSWFANALPAENWDTTVVIPFPTRSPEADPKAVVGGITMGFYLTKAAWDSPEEGHRDAAVSLLAYMTSPEATDMLSASFEGKLLESQQAMIGDATALLTPISDSMFLDARMYWYSQILPMARGEADPRQVMQEVINMGAFTKDNTQAE